MLYNLSSLIHGLHFEASLLFHVLSTISILEKKTSLSSSLVQSIHKIN